jgi:hypothetical protein
MMQTLAASGVMGGGEGVDLDTPGVLIADGDVIDRIGCNCAQFTRRAFWQSPLFLVKSAFLTDPCDGAGVI